MSGVVPSKVASAPLPAVGEALVKAGQFAAQVPVQAVVVPLSFVNRYSVMPLESTKILPNVGLSVVMTVSLLIEVVLAPAVGTAVALAVDAGLTASPVGETAYQAPSNPSPLTSPGLLSLAKVYNRWPL